MLFLICVISYSRENLFFLSKLEQHSGLVLVSGFWLNSVHLLPIFQVFWNNLWNEYPFNFFHNSKYLIPCRFPSLPISLFFVYFVSWLYEFFYLYILVIFYFINIICHSRIEAFLYIFVLFVPFADLGNFRIMRFACSPHTLHCYFYLTLLGSIPESMLA